MTRMTRELSLVLLGSSMLSAGYFAAPSPEEELDKKVEKAASKQIGHPYGSHIGSRGYVLIYVHSTSYRTRYASGGSLVSGRVSRGGFGRSGAAMGAGG